jgi:AraC family transcriptional regulator
MGQFREFRGKIVNCRTVANFRVVESRYSSHEYVPRHCHEQAYISIVLAGSYSEKCGAATSHCTAGQTIYHACGESHSDRFGDHDAALLNLVICPQMLSELSQLGLQSDTRSVCASQYCLQLAIKLRRECFLVDDPVSGLAVEGLALELCAETFRRREKNIGRSDWLGQVDSILRDRFREPVTLAQVAGDGGVHPVHLARAFRKRFGYCVGDQIRKLRIEAACRELHRSGLSIAEIAARTGFADQSHLSRTIKSHTGMSPREFRFAQARFSQA